MINIIETDDGGGVYADGGTYANEVLLFSVNPTEYTGKKVLALPRCCQHKKGTQDRRLINGLVAERDSEIGNASEIDLVCSAAQDVAAKQIERLYHGSAAQPTCVH